MSTLTLLIQVGGVLLILFFFFLIYMCTKTWRAAHVVMSFLVFAAAIAFLIVASMSLKTHLVWRRLYDLRERELREVTLRNEVLEKGTGREGDDAEFGIRELRSRLTRQVLDRGRVWRGAKLLGKQDDGTNIQELRFQIPAVVAIGPEGPADGGAAPADPNGAPADPNAAPGDPNAAPVNPTAQPGDPNAQPGPVLADNGIINNMLIYVFGDDSWTDPANNAIVNSLPRQYVGEFKVTAVTPTEITMVPTMPVPVSNLPPDWNDQAEKTWTLYEIMPLDTHIAFAGLNRQQLASLLTLPEETRESTLNAYLRDGQQATDMDPPENVWAEVEFKRRHQVDVDSEVDFDTLKGEFYDANGRAMMVNLRRGEQAEIQPGQRGLFPTEEAESLEDQGIVEIIRPVFVRKLNDYEYHFRWIHRQNEFIAATSAAINRKKEKVDESIRLGRQQSEFREDEKLKLESDLANLQRELEEIAAYETRLSEKQSQLRERLFALFKENLQLDRELKEISDRITEDVERRARDAVEAQAASVTAGG